MKVAYDINITGSNDTYISTAEEAMNGLAIAGMYFL